jgi:hypothetical protein
VVASTATAIALGMDRGAILANVLIGAPASLFTPWARPR